MTTELDTLDLTHLEKYLAGGSYRKVADAIYSGECFTSDQDIASLLGVGIATGRKYGKAIREVAGCGVEELSPRRRWCSAEAFVVALRHVCKQQIANLGGRDVLMSERVRQEVCRLLFLDEVGFGKVLIACLDFNYLSRGTTSGNYGTFVNIKAA